MTRTALPTSNQRASGDQSRKSERSNSRGGDKRRTNRLAWLVVDGQRQRFHASLREVTEEGAKLTVSGLMGIPDRFLLYVEPDCIRYECAVSHSKGNMVGVRFISTTQNVRYRDDHR